MAFLPDDQDPNKPQQPGQESQTDAAAAQPAQPKTVQDKGASQIDQPAAAPQQPSSSGQWTNLQTYLGANQEQAQQEGQQVGGAVAGKAESANQNLQNTANAFGQNVKANTVNYDQNATNSAINAAMSAKAGSSQNPNDVAAFQKQYNANYAGPSDFTQNAGYGALSSDVAGAQTGVDQTKTAAGRDVLLSNQYGKASAGGYNSGQRGFDALLLGGNKQNQENFGNIQNKWGGIQNSLNQTSAQQTAAAQQAAATTAATRDQTRKALSTAQGNFQSKLQGELAASKAAQAQQMTRAQNELSSAGGLSEELKNSFGLTNYDSTNGVNSAAFLKSGPQRTMANVASADEYAQSNALAQLAGGEGGFLDQSNASQAGTAGGPYSFDTAGYNSALEARNKPQINAAVESDEQKARAAIQQVAGNMGGPFSALLTPKPQAQLTDEQKYQQQRMQLGQVGQNPWSGINGAIR